MPLSLSFLKELMHNISLSLFFSFRVEISNNERKEKNSFKKNGIPYYNLLKKIKGKKKSKVLFWGDEKVLIGTAGW